MARQRLVKPGFFQHYELYRAELVSGLPLRLAYEGLWCVADRRGVFRWKPVELKLQVLPYDPVDFAQVLEALWAAGFLARYVVAGKEYGHIPTMKDHQSFNRRENPSAEPGPDHELAEHRTSTVPAPDQHQTNIPGTGTGTGTGTGWSRDTSRGERTPPAPKQPPPNWVAAIHAELLQVGACSFGQVGKLCKDLYALHGDRLIAAAGAYRRDRHRRGVDGSRFVKKGVVADFADQAGVFVDHIAPIGETETGRELLADINR